MKLAHVGAFRQSVRTLKTPAPGAPKRPVHRGDYPRSDLCVLLGIDQHWGNGVAVVVLWYCTLAAFNQLAEVPLL